MMVTPEHVLSMARYNAWQNKQMKAALRELGDAACREDRGAFFGSILGTVNHLLWGDGRWMGRFDGGEAQTLAIEKSPGLTPNLSEWAVARFHMDGRILLWAEKLHAVDLAGDLTWTSGAGEAPHHKPMGLCVVHMFNHQTHHRGQVHAMVTAAGGKGWVTDLPFMSEEGPWL
ncbi:DinB family protein [Marimonas lutisalis]|uniref:DinB family protein n=1 Tax=Marimonas lutisalis TaxID=2545756 RepID=UPI002E255CD9